MILFVPVQLSSLLPVRRASVNSRSALVAPSHHETRITSLDPRILTSIDFDAQLSQSSFPSVQERARSLPKDASAAFNDDITTCYAAVMVSTRTSSRSARVYSRWSSSLLPRLRIGIESRRLISCRPLSRAGHRVPGSPRCNWM